MQMPKFKSKSKFKYILKIRKGSPKKWKFQTLRYRISAKIGRHTQNEDMCQVIPFDFRK